MRAAVPKYLGAQFGCANPGARFGMYFSGWCDGDWKLEDGKRRALEGAARLSDADKKIVSEIRRRQKAQFDALPESKQRLKVRAVSSAPFMTGLGNEHPTENGFSFLNPYGLPYLPGSAVKGVVRRAAEELAEEDDGDSEGWSNEVISTLFGTPNQIGAVSFWDVIPSPKASKLDVEVMTPHYSHYYQRDQSPHDSGNPNPILFLSVPPESEFDFYIRCDKSRLAHDSFDWDALVRKALLRAFDWLGFGAKTSVGYGAMKLSRAEERDEEKRAEQEEARRQQEEQEKNNAEIKRQEAEERTQKEEQLASMPENKRLLRLAAEAVDLLEANRNNQPIAEAARKALKPLEEKAPSWQEAVEREEAAKLHERLWEVVGWFVVGANKKQKEKQRNKKKTILEKIRTGP